jgi:hypothetical protein
MSKQNFGLVSNAKEQLVKRFLARRDNQPEATGMLRSAPNLAQIPDKFCRFDKSLLLVGCNFCYICFLLISAIVYRN